MWIMFKHDHKVNIFYLLKNCFIFGGYYTIALELVLINGLSNFQFLIKFNTKITIHPLMR